MKLSLCTGAALLLCAPRRRTGGSRLLCERVKSDIQQKIINNGVPEMPSAWPWH